MFFFQQKTAYEMRISDWSSDVCSSDLVETMAEAPAAEAAPAPATEDAAVPAPQLQAAMRDLWHGHIVHTRDYALAVHAGNDADAKAAADAVHRKIVV